ncbi:UNVERIFIED_CONTAM: hypothetical protein Sangu_2885700 [Sesamum angustifolium]|uniref:DUF4216 domain-containing protein n=1 Tax=Sesamum angustifolium TaxID=2727405 RepID=A0AAW2INT7_9LAMI
MDINGKMKDNMNARTDLKIICIRPKLELDERRPNVMPKAIYTPGKEQKRRVCEWIRGLNFLDGYASNLACCVDMTKLRMHGMKSHDCHVFMQKLIPIAFRETLPEASDATKKTWLSLPEWHIIKTYILTNCEVGTPYYDAKVTSFNAYFVNGYNFQTKRHDTGKSTMNCECPWVDQVRGMKVHPSYHLVDVNIKKLYQKDDLFILARQAVQVYFTEYPSTSWRLLPENNDDNEDEDEDCGGNDEIDDEEYEAT